MNAADVLKKMLEAGATAAKADWERASGFVKEEFKRLADAAVKIAAKFKEEMAAAAHVTGAVERAKAEEKARRRLKFSYEELEGAKEGLKITAAADVKLAAQNAINAALGVLKEAVNEAIGVAVL